MHVSHTASLFLTFVVAIVFSALHLVTPRIRRLLAKRENAAVSFGAGMAVVYVFNQLIPEIAVSHKGIAEHVYLLMLLGFVVFYGLNYYVHKHTLLYRLGKSAEHKVGPFHLHLIFGFAYSALFVYTTPGQFQINVAAGVLSACAIGLHLINSDQTFEKHHKEPFEAWGRYVLAAAPIVGAIVDLFTPPHRDLFYDTMLALLAGFVIFNVLRDELPNPDEAKFPWFAGGAILYVTLLQLSQAHPPGAHGGGH